MRFFSLGLVAVVAVLSGCGPPPKDKPSPAAAKPLQEVLWPRAASAPAPPAVAVGKPTERPRAEPKAEPPRKIDRRKPPVERVKQPKRGKTPLRPDKLIKTKNGGKPKIEVTSKRDEAGPDLPYPCWLVRIYAAGKTQAELEALGRANGVTLSPKQRRQAAACLR